MRGKYLDTDWDRPQFKPDKFEQVDYNIKLT
jgi:hypothetical protein